jgi:hypothetical protein
MTEFFNGTRECLPDERRGVSGRYQKKDLALRSPVWESWARCAQLS